MIPALASVLIAWIYITLNLTSLDQARAITQAGTHDLSHITKWVSIWLDSGNLLNAFYQGTIGAFIHDIGTSFNSVLWTMQYEFIGSMGLFMFLLLFGRSPVRWVLYPILVVGLAGTWFTGFIIGIALADLYVNRQYIFDRLKRWQLWSMLGAGLILGGIPYNGITGTIYQYIQIPGWSINQNQALWGSIAAMFVIVAVLNVTVLKKLIGSRPLVRLGSYTYSLYLVHHPLIYTVGMSLFIFFLHHFSYNQSVFISAAALVPVIILATVLFYHYIEKPAIKFAGGFEKFVSSNKSVLLPVQRIGKKIQYLCRRLKFF